MLRISIELNERTTTLTCEGRIVAGCEIDMLKAIAANQVCDVLELNLENVQDADASALSAFVNMREQATRWNREFVIVNPSERVFELLRIVGLDWALKVEFRPVLRKPKGRRSIKELSRSRALFAVQVGA